MIRGVIIVNNHGKPRLVKFYQTVVGEERVSFTKCNFEVIEKSALCFCVHSFTLFSVRTAFCLLVVLLLFPAAVPATAVPSVCAITELFSRALC